MRNAFGSLLVACLYWSNAIAQETQLAAEVWATAGAGTRLALASQIALEQWVVVPSAARRIGNTAVTVNTG